ncbi:zinc ribbon domain-containing protein [Syntrophomonas wolfei]|uniref:zinc ribbon domain-containing protein n=1 Tax=Syntrophomonas wolfei TaxID=863 RepID=UPI000773D8FA|nr:zinc ribbon domain-containing protein [Syntrophomonas wolfei]MDD3909859.1 zinc ribbon domain-containing protein [Proteiniphilum sp.]
MKICIACGMPMNKPADFAMGDESKDYCLYCCNPDGSMHSYEEKLNGLTAFIIRTQGLDEQAACSAAQSMMAKLPAWKDRNNQDA